MTSEEIQKQIQKLLPDDPRGLPMGLTLEGARSVALLEIAFQLARHNERELAGDSVDWQERCECTHKRLYHHATGCSHGECKCEGWRAA